MLCRLSPSGNKPLSFHTQTIRHACDVIEIADDLNRIVDGAIAESEPAKPIQVARLHRLTLVGQLCREMTQCQIGRLERRLPPIPSDGMNESVRRGRIIELGCDLFPEVVGVGLSSIVTAQFGRYDRGEQLTLHACQRRVPLHDRDVEAQAVPHRRGVEAHDVDDSPDPARASNRLIKHLLQ